ncbi:MAG: DUF2064 domain-containing protein [Phaeodactylibacter sp.]|nr:DUF2064 domain-containing protein [Phaeodactylibacter sp.]
MTAPSQNTALLLFLRDEAQEALAKPLAVRGRRANRSVYRQLNNHARRQARLSGLPLLVVEGRRQSGHTFGERLANAFEYAFGQGYRKVIAIGNDCPALDAGILKEAARQFGQSEIVLGPARDGGVYLLGLSRQAYRRDLFLALPWQTDQLCTALCRYARQWAHEPRLLREEEDADDAVTLRRLLGLLPFRSRLRKALENLLASSAEPPYAPPFVLPAGRHQVSLKRGPPASKHALRHTFTYRTSIPL